MKRKRADPVFVEYVMDQNALLPASYEDVIEEKHLVRVVNAAIEKIDLRALLRRYKGGGRSSFHPKMMLKVLVYAYTQKIYSSRKIAKALRENIHFMWISGGNRPDFRTINAFRSSRLKPVIEEVFAEVLGHLIESGHVKMENYFVDGSKIEADANKHKVVWAKQNKNYRERVVKQIEGLFEQIEAENDAEQEIYGDGDLEELGENSIEEVNSERLRERMEELNRRLQEKVQEEGESWGPKKKALRKMAMDCLPRLERYEKQEQTLAGRGSYAKTDEDASCLRMKEDRGAEKAWPKPAYNVQIGTEGQYIVGYSVHQQAGDTTCLIPHLEGVRSGLKRLPKRIVSDAGYGSEENYAYLERYGIENYLKYNTFYQETHRYRDPAILRKHQFRAENFGYDAEKDQFICPGEKRLHFKDTSRHKTDNGYESERRNYECQDCEGCPLKPQCSQTKGNRKIRISLRLLEYRRRAKENLTSEKGQRLRSARSTEVETVFGHLKHNMGFRRFHLRGLEKVKTEWGILSIAHNMQKMVAK